MAADAGRGDAISVREGKRLLRAWFQAEHDQFQKKSNRRNHWEINPAAHASWTEANLKLDGPASAIGVLKSLRLKKVTFAVAATLPGRMIAEGHRNTIAKAANMLNPISKLFLSIPLALAGHAVEINTLKRGLEGLWRWKLNTPEVVTHAEGNATNWHTLNTALTACELLTWHGAASSLVEKVLDSFLVPKLLNIANRHQHKAEPLNFIFRAYALRETRAGNVPFAKDIFGPRTKPTAKAKARQHDQHDQQKEEHDRRLMELTNAVFDIYVAIADALVNRKSQEELTHRLQSAVNNLKGDEWRIRSQPGTGGIRALAAQTVTVLLAAGYDPHAIKQAACQIHMNWPRGYDTQKERLFARLCLRGELHAPLLQDISQAAEAVLKMRVGAEDKMGELVTYSRMLKSISPADASAIFNHAITVASELDTEIMTQICLLDKLTTHGRDAFTAPRQTARNVAHVVADAALRLDVHDHFPWAEAMSTLVQLDLPNALANAAQWADTEIADLTTTLPPLLGVAIEHERLTLGQAAALAQLYKYNFQMLCKIARMAAEQNALPILAEVCHEMQIHHAWDNQAELLSMIEPYRQKIPIVDDLIRQWTFLAAIQKERTTGQTKTTQPDHPRDIDNTSDTHQWDRDTLIDAEKLISLINVLDENATSKRTYFDVREILRDARSAVTLRDRIAHLDAIAQLNKLRHPGSAVRGMMETIEAWYASPAVKQWCQTKWPEVIVSWMPEFDCYLRYGPDKLTPAIALTGLSAGQVQDLILRGIEQHGDHFTADHLFVLVKLIGATLPAQESAELVDWYIARLASRIAAGEDLHITTSFAIPEKTDEAIARFIFALMGDFDVRIRWRAAHAARRLARTGENATLLALTKQYARQEETAFRDPKLPFYWNAARLWFVIAWDRIASERPDSAIAVADKLLQIALDDAFPHVLVRAFARDACKKLLASGHFTIDKAQTVALGHVNVSRLQRQLTVDAREGQNLTIKQGSRFHFDLFDTLHHWYEPWLSVFANIDGTKFIQAVEYWIVEMWGYGNEANPIAEVRHKKLAERDWQLTTNEQGSKPTLERFQTHLEWHGMWCAIGELLKTEALARKGGGYWRDFTDKMLGEKLIQGPAWAADLQTPLPLLRRNWLADLSPFSDWIGAVVETDYQAEIFNQDKTGYLVIYTYIDRRNTDRKENIWIRSALTESRTSVFLLRALQTMADASGYKLPDDGEDEHELREEPYRLLGWLQTTANHSGMDEQDPLQGYSSTISKAPGKRITKACRLRRDASGRAQWTAEGEKEPMFIFESWGKETDKEPWHLSIQETTGYRLLVNKNQLQAFLTTKKMNLIVKVEINRGNQKNRRYSADESEKQQDRKFTQLYLIRADGKLENTSGHLGTWTGDCSATELTEAR